MTRAPVDDARRRIRDALAVSARPAISCSFQPGGLAVVHLLRDLGAEVPVLFVDTGYHFAETLEFRDRVVAQWGLDVRSVRTEASTRDHLEQLGRLHRTDPDLCCATRKTGPLFDALDHHDLWLTGLRRDQAETRRDTRITERRVLPSGRVLAKVNPIADWTLDELEAYTAMHDIPVHPLLDQGYPSIGCAPCTERTDEDDPRSGRWGGTKRECGLHTGLDLVEATPGPGT